MTIYQALSGNFQARECIEELTRSTLNVGGTIADALEAVESVPDAFPVNPVDCEQYARECWIEFSADMPDLNREELLPVAESTYLKHIQPIDTPVLKQFLDPKLSAELLAVGKQFATNPVGYYRAAMQRKQEASQVYQRAREHDAANSYDLWQDYLRCCLFAALSVHIRKLPAKLAPMPDEYGQTCSRKNPERLAAAHRYWVKVFQTLGL